MMLSEREVDERLEELRPDMHHFEREALETAKALYTKRLPCREAEVAQARYERAERERDEWHYKANERLNALADAEMECERLREALETIAATPGYGSLGTAGLHDLARAALTGIPTEETCPYERCAGDPCTRWTFFTYDTQGRPVCGYGCALSAVKETPEREARDD